MSEEKKVIYCTQCGSENDPASKFCSSCGMKLEQSQRMESTQSEDVFSGYEKITDAEEVKPASNPYQEEIKINYSSDRNSYNNSSYNTYYDNQQYYSGETDSEKTGGGNIGFAIASLVCGIISLVCCCLSLFSALLGIAAIVLGVITLSFKYDGKAMAIAGIATGGVAVFMIIMAMILRSTPFYREIINELTYEFYY